MRMSPSAGLAALAVTAATLGACGSGASAGEVEVVSTKTACTSARTEFEAGSTTFRIVNKGDQATELYVLTKGGKVVGEVENVGPGTSRTLRADLKAGDYELACKPGQTGNGIRQAITVTGSGGGEGGEDAEAYDREIELKAVDFAFDGAVSDVKVGERIEFKLHNQGTVEHELEVFGPDGRALGEIGPTAPGATGEAVLAFTVAGAYTYKCGIDDHAERGMTGTFTVA